MLLRVYLLLGIAINYSNATFPPYCCYFPPPFSTDYTQGFNSLVDFISTSSNTSTPSKYPEPSAVDIINKNGYKAEVHNVTTKDGYILTLHRILKIATDYHNVSRPPVFLQHGLFSESTHWLIQLCILPFLLVEQGYDVWLGNARGNRYSRGHVNLTTNDNAYWRFSWHEMGIYDLPAVIDYILKTTNSSKLSYIGHSMGTTMFFVMASQCPEYLKYILIYIAFAPVAFLCHVRGLMRVAGPALAAGGMYDLLVDHGGGEFFPRYLCEGEFPFIAAFTGYAPYFCGYDSAYVCAALFHFGLMGFNYCYFTPELWQDIMACMPSSSATKAMVHFAQLMTLFPCRFRQFDYGWYGNIDKYKTPTPPDYNLSSISAHNVPTVIYYGENDYLASPEDVEMLVQYLPNAKFVKLLGCFNHIDFLWGRVCDILYKLVIDELNQIHSLV